MDTDQLIKEYLEATNDRREQIRNSFDNDTAWSFLKKCKDLSVEAVRQNNYDFIKQGLVLQSIENARTDKRDNIVRLSLLYNSARKLHQDPDILFEEIAHISAVEIKEILLNFIKRTEREKSISVMGYKEINDPGFDYIYS